MKITQYHEAGLIVVEGLVDPQLAEEFADEQLELNAARIERARDLGFSHLHRQYYAHKFISGNTATAASAKLFSSVIDPTGAERNYLRANVNVQLPNTPQGFHIDTVLEPVLILHCSDNGSFHYAHAAQTEAEAETAYESIDVEAGTGVIEAFPDLFHRGANNGAGLRVTVGLAKSSLASNL